MAALVRRVAILGFVVGLGLLQPLSVRAGEHGGQEHGGSSVAAPKEHGGSKVAAASGDSALLREAAAALRKGQARPDLASKLEQLADAKAGN